MKHTNIYPILPEYKAKHGCVIDSLGDSHCADSTLTHSSEQTMQAPFRTEFLLSFYPCTGKQY